MHLELILLSKACEYLEPSEHTFIVSRCQSICYICSDLRPLLGVVTPAHEGETPHELFMNLQVLALEQTFNDLIPCCLLLCLTDDYYLGFGLIEAFGMGEVPV